MACSWMGVGVGVASRCDSGNNLIGQAEMRKRHYTSGSKYLRLGATRKSLG